jgi:hypothetical protein
VLRCETCRTSWPAAIGSLETHGRGRKHRENVLSEAFYGEPGHQLDPLRFDNVDLPHRALPAALAARARDIWALITSDTAAIVGLCGVDLYARVIALLAPERLACAAVRLHLTPADSTPALFGPPSQDVWRCDLRSPAAVAYAASLLEQRVAPHALRSVLDAQDQRGTPPALELHTPLALVELTLGPAAGSGTHSPELWLAFAHSSALLGRALRRGCAAGAVRIVLRTGAAEPSPAESAAAARLVVRLVAAIGAAVGAPAGMRDTRRLELELPPHAWRAEHEGLLRDAEARSWRARCLALLLGAHARVGCASPLRLLPAPLLELVLTHASAAGRTAVSVGRASAAQLGAPNGALGVPVLGVLPPPPPCHADLKVVLDRATGRPAFAPTALHAGAPAAQPAADLLWLQAHVGGGGGGGAGGGTI